MEQAHRRRTARRWAAAAVAAAVLAAATSPVAADDGEPFLTLDPLEGPCGATVTARGTDFPPGATVYLYLGRVDSGSAAEVSRTVAGADGAFAVELRMPSGNEHVCAEGTTWRVEATTWNGKSGADRAAAAGSEARYWVRANLQPSSLVAVESRGVTPEAQADPERAAPSTPGGRWPVVGLAAVGAAVLGLAVGGVWALRRR